MLKTMNELKPNEIIKVYLCYGEKDTGIFNLRAYSFETIDLELPII